MYGFYGLTDGQNGLTDRTDGQILSSAGISARWTDSENGRILGLADGRTDLRFGGRTDSRLSH